MNASISRRTINQRRASPMRQSVQQHHSPCLRISEGPRISPALTPKPPRKIILASPIEPSGASWLINCLLELGIRVEHHPAVERLWRIPQDSTDPSPLWVAEGDKWRLHPRAAVLAKWMPSLLHTPTFTFRDDIVVEYYQSLPTADHADQTVALFLRDPRDSIYSHYRRRAADLSFDAYCASLNADTLLSPAEHWALFAWSWRALAGPNVYRFEDYKSDANALLGKITGDLGLTVSNTDITRAVAQSTSERAKEAEATYRLAHPNDTQIANRAGKVGDGRERAANTAAVAAIESAASSAMRDIGYDVDTAQPEDGAIPLAHLRDLPVFHKILLPAELKAAISKGARGDTSLGPVLDRIRRLNESDLAAAGRPAAESQRLIDNCRTFLTAYTKSTAAHLDQLETVFADGAAHHMGTLRKLMRERRASKTHRTNNG